MYLITWAAVLIDISRLVQEANYSKQGIIFLIVNSSAEFTDISDGYWD